MFETKHLTIQQTEASANDFFYYWGENTQLDKVESDGSELKSISSCRTLHAEHEKQITQEHIFQIISTPEVSVFSIN